MNGSYFQIRECVKCSRIVFTWATGHTHIVKRHDYKSGYGLYSEQFNYYK